MVINSCGSAYGAWRIIQKTAKDLTTPSKVQKCILPDLKGRKTKFNRKLFNYKIIVQKLQKPMMLHHKGKNINFNFIPFEAVAFLILYLHSSRSR